MGHSAPPYQVATLPSRLCEPKERRGCNDAWYRPNSLGRILGFKRAEIPCRITDSFGSLARRLAVPTRSCGDSLEEPTICTSWPDASRTGSQIAVQTVADLATSAGNIITDAPSAGKPAEAYHGRARTLIER